MRRAITGALLIDGTGGAARPGSTVVWDDDTISWVGPDGDADIAGASVIEAGGGALLPGLIDAHVHLCVDPVADGIDRLAEESTAKAAVRSTSAAKRLLDAGITTVRDQGSKDGVAIEVASAQRSGWLIATRVLAAGRGITPAGGHGWMIGVEANGPEEVAAAVATEIERGADVIKMFPTGGVLGSGAHGFATTMTLEELRSGVESAHDRNRLVGAHIHGPAGVDLGLAAGVDTVEHGTGVTAEQAERMAVTGVALVPTLTAVDMALAQADALPAGIAARLEEVREHAAAGVARAIGAGVRVLPGTDAGTPFNPPGLLVHEMTRLAELGLGTGGAIRAATSEAAATLRLDDLGVVAPGMRADLLLVAGDPLTDLAALSTPRVVVQDGKMRVVSQPGQGR